MVWVDEFVLFSNRNISDEVRESLWFRGVSDKQISEFSLGYIDGALPSHIEFPADFREWSRQGSKLVNSYVLPLTNPLGETLGLQFRSVDRDVRGYLDYFLTRSEPVLFGLGQAMPHVWETGSVCIVEGAFDLLPVQRALPFAVSTLTSQLSEVFVRCLYRLVNRIYLFYDSDLAGRRSSYDITQKYKSDFEIRSIEYPRGVSMVDGKLVKDPADLWEAWGDERLLNYLVKSTSE